MGTKIGIGEKELKKEDKMVEKKKEIEKVNSEVDIVLPSGEGKGGEKGKPPAPIEEAIMVDEKTIEHLEKLAEIAPRIIEARRKIRMAILKTALSGGWVIFESKDQAGVVHRKAEMGFAEADRIMGDFGVQFRDITWRKEVEMDKAGEKVTFWYEGFVSGGNIRNLWVQARACTRDKFFGKSHGEAKPIEEIDIASVQQAAYHCLLKEGVKLVFGLRSIPAEELEKEGVKLSTAQTISFPSSGSGYKKPARDSNLASPAQLTLIKNRVKEAKLPEDALQNHLEVAYQISETSQLPKDKVTELLEWIDRQKKGKKQEDL